MTEADLLVALRAQLDHVAKDIASVLIVAESPEDVRAHAITVQKRIRDCEALLRRAGSPQLKPNLWCSGCGCRWSAPEGFIMHGVVHLCGDCWRTAQPIVHGVPAGSPQTEQEQP